MKGKRTLPLWRGFFRVFVLIFENPLKRPHFKFFPNLSRNNPQVIHSIHSNVPEITTTSSGETKKFFCRWWEKRTEGKKISNDETKFRKTQSALPF